MSEFIKKIKVQAEVAKNLDKALAKVSSYAEGRIKKHTPVVTGRLRSSMKAKKFKFLEHGVITNVKYAPYVEYGTKRFAGRKMMRKGINEAQKKADFFIKKEMKKL